MNETLNPPGSLPPRSGNALPPGSVVGDFTIQSLLGEGRLGFVYRALDNFTQREVAVKEFMPKTLAGRNFDGRVELYGPQYEAAFRAGLEGFVDEAKLLAQFDHKALVKVLRLFEAYDTAYMAMPLYEGRTLKEILQESPTLDEPSLKAMLAPLLDALETLHGAGCFHCDVSAENILIVDDDNGPVLLEFGAPLRLIGHITQAGTGVPRAGYAPVEQYDGSARIGPWTDIYALAAVVRLAITGRLPPPSVTRATRDSMKPLAQLAPRFGPTLVRAVDRGLAVQPQDRPQTIAEFRRTLGLAVVSVRLPAPLLGTTPTVPQAARQRVAAVLKPPSKLEPVAHAGDTTWTRPDTTVSPAVTPAAKPKRASSVPVRDPVASSPRRGPHVGIGLATIMLIVGAAYFVMPGFISEPSPERVAGDPAPTPLAVSPTAPDPAPAQPPAAPDQPGQAATTPEAAPRSSQPAEAPAAPAPVGQPPTPPPATGVVKLDVKPWGEVVVDGRARGLSPPLKTLQLREGPHRIELRNPVGPPLVREITVSASGAVQINHTFR